MTKSDIMEVSDTPLYNIRDIQSIEYDFIEEEEYKCIIARRWSSVRKIPRTDSYDYTYIQGKMTRQDLVENGDYRLLLFNIMLDNKYNIKKIESYVCKPIVYNYGHTKDNIQLIKEPIEYSGSHPVFKMVIDTAKNSMSKFKNILKEM